MNIAQIKQCLGEYQNTILCTLCAAITWFPTHSQDILYSHSAISYHQRIQALLPTFAALLLLPITLLKLRRVTDKDFDHLDACLKGQFKLSSRSKYSGIFRKLAVIHFPCILTPSFPRLILLSFPLEFFFIPTIPNPVSPHPKQ